MNLGLGSAATQPSTAFDPAGAAASAVAGISLTGTLQKSNNLSDLASPATARTNLGLGSASTQASTAFDVAGAATAAQGASLQKTSNLGDLTSAPTARTNLGLGTAATAATTAFDPAGAAAAVQAGLGTAASQPSSAFDPAGAASNSGVATRNAAGMPYGVTDPLSGKLLTRSGDRYNAWVSLPRLMATLTSYNEATRPPINGIGGGSSVGNCATCVNVLSPHAYLAQALQQRFDQLGIYNWQSENISTNGSTVGQFSAAGTGYFDTYMAAGVNTPPSYVDLAYGMNDGATPQFNAGQTFGPAPGAFQAQLEAGIRKAQAAGADVILYTTPHPKHAVCTGVANDAYQTWSMPSTIAETYPVAVAAPVADTALYPPAASSEPMVDILGIGTPVPVSWRHYRVNQAIRQAAADTGAALIDVEHYWFEAVAKYGECALFNPGEFVHPNDLGHTVSYNAAIDDFVSGLVSGTSQSGARPGFTAGLSAAPTIVAFNAMAASTPVTVLTPSTPGLLQIDGFQSGVGTQHATYDVSVNHAGTAAYATLLGTSGNATPITAVFAVSVSGLNVQVTPGYAQTDINVTFLPTTKAQ